jgi:MFS family permease
MSSSFPNPVASPRLRRRFATYLFAAACADSGYWIAIVAQGWLVVKLTDSPLWLGLVAAAAQLPFLLFSLAGGELADRVNRRFVIASCNVLMAVVATLVAILVATGTISVGLLALLGFITGTLHALEHPVDRAWVYDLVEGRQLGRAIALSSLEWATARTLGPAIGGAAIAAIGIAAGYGANALMVVPMIVLALMLRTRNSPLEEPASDAPVPATLPPHAIVVFSIFTGIFTIGVTPYEALLPDIAKNTFGQSASGYGIMAAAGGIGAICGAAALALRGDFAHRGRAATIAALCGALLLVLFAHTHALLAAIGVLVAMGIVDTLMYALGNTFVQHIASNEGRGRANAIFSVAFLGGIPVGNALLGILAGRFGSGPVLGWSGSVVAVAAIAFWLAFPRTRDAA